MLATRMFQRLDSHDRGLLGRWALGAEVGRLHRGSWIAITHSGGAVATIAAVALPLVAAPWPRIISVFAAISLAVSHLMVQAIKRSVLRERPRCVAHIRCPDRFSFPSGHATAALAVALSYAVAFPTVTLPLVSFALLVGWSRVVLGVHYPGDVLVGQSIAFLTVAGVALAF
jgi:undecaprenyl-diphosphatase